MQNRLEYVKPETVGISSKAVSRLIDQLEHGITEPHGILMTRHGKVFAEGYWKPYTSGMVHGMQSLTKTYAGTAIGIAVELGFVSLNEKIVDIFPEEAKSADQKYLPELTVEHVLSMSTGMRTISSFEGNWIVNFLNNPIVDRPGTAFFYNSVGSTLLGEIVRRKTGENLDEFLVNHLYERIGIDPEKMKWVKLRDGLAIGGSGLYSTLYNNTKLGLLYMNHGQWNGEQIISREFCEKGSKKRVDNSAADGIPSDGHMGYGYQMWMGLHKDTYCMSGAWGQYTIMCPNEDIVISFSGRTNDAVQASSDTLLGKFWNFLDEGIDKGTDQPEDTADLEKKLSDLSLPAEPYQPYGNKKFFTGTYQIVDGEFDLDLTTGGIMQKCFWTYPIDTFRLEFTEDTAVMKYHNILGDHILEAGLDGLPRLNHIVTPPFPCDKVYVSACFERESLVFSLRWIETCYSARIYLIPKEKGLIIRKEFDDVDPMGEGIHHQADAQKTELER